jgi:hypothetical protein
MRRRCIRSKINANPGPGEPRLHVGLIFGSSALVTIRANFAAMSDGRARRPVPPGWELPGGTLLQGLPAVLLNHQSRCPLCRSSSSQRAPCQGADPCDRSSIVRLWVSEGLEPICGIMRGYVSPARLYSRAVAPDVIHDLITSGAPGRLVSNQAAGITLWLSRNMLAGS